jgi:hypothetical protein
MFGCVVSGRPFQPFMQISEAKFLYSIVDAAKVGHVVVFLLGTVPIPSGYGASVYLSWANQEWKFLGFLSNEKPSAIFKISCPENQSMDTIVAQIGVSIDKAEAITQEVNFKLNVESSKNPTPNDTYKLSTYLIENLSNFALSFSQNAMITSFQEAIPTDVFRKWLVNIDNKIKKDPNFWKS